MKTNATTARLRAVVTAVYLGLAAAAAAVDRFPRPEFKSGHKQPIPTTPPAPAWYWDYIDAALMAAALALASYLVLRRRSRRALVGLMLFSAAVFGFWHKGCICPVGSIQNIALALADTSYAIPLTAILLFAVPLLTALFVGRTFCGAVCPLGALQDVVVLRPLRVPAWLDHTLRLLPPLYLALAVLLTVTGAGFLICRYDPFVGLYRLDASAGMLIAGVAVLALGIFVGRPYCRYLCPYGVLLGWCSLLSRRHATITPDECIQCRLCEDTCPFGAIRPPTPARPPEPPAAGRRRLAAYLAAVPLLLILGAAVGRLAGKPLANLHNRVALAETILREDAAGDGRMTLDSETFRAGGESPATLMADALNLRRQFTIGGAWVGAFMGLVIGGRLVALSRRAPRRDYEPDRETCFSCARCFAACPREHVRLKNRQKGERS